MDTFRHDRLRRAAQWMADRKSETVDALTRWCDQNSWSLDVASLRSMSTMLAHDFGQCGIKLDAVPLPELKLLGDGEDWAVQPTGPLLVWHHNADSPKRILLMIHYDTVYPPETQPDRCQLHDNHLIGPGAADAKGGVAVIWLATQAIMKYGLAENVGVSICLNPDEEIGTTASNQVIRDYASNFDRALVFEPTLPDGSMVASRKGSGNFSISVRGRSAHAGRNPEDGRNAIVQAAKLTLAVNQLHDPDQGVMVNVGRILGGGPLNQVPDRAVLHLNARVADVVSMLRIADSLKAIVNELSRDDFQLALHGEFHSPPKIVDEPIRNIQADFERAAQQAGRKVRWKDTGGACDGSKLAAWGLPNVDTMGVDGGGLHSPYEFCDIDSIVPAAITVAELISHWDAT